MGDTAARPGLTVAIIARDERTNLEELLPSLEGVADEVIVVDTGSTDGTADVARRCGARLVEFPWIDDFSAARNAGLALAATSHVLWLDADDRVERGDLVRIRTEALAHGRAGLFLLLINEDPEPSSVSSCFQLRVFPSDPRHRFEGRVHEQIHAALARTGTPTRRLDIPIRHRGYLDSEEVMRKARRNLRLLRREMDGEGANDLNVLYHFVKAASRAGAIEEGIEVARRTLAAPPPGSPGEVLQALRVLEGQLESRRGRRAEALRAYGAAVGSDPADPVPRFFLGLELRAAGELQEAAIHLEVARHSPVRAGNLPIPVAGLHRAIRLQLGEILELLGRPAEAVAVYGEARRGGIDDAILRRATARALLACGRLAEAESLLRDLPQQMPDDAESHFLAATLEFLRGDAPRARSLYERAEGLDPQGWAAPLHLGHLSLRRGDLPDALAQYSKALSRAELPETRIGMAACQLECGLVEESLEHLARAVELAGDRPLPLGTEALSGEAFFQAGALDLALASFEKDLRRRGPDARILGRVADCYEALGHGEVARIARTKAQELAATIG
jgi:tetratricopeptide (TPR) repeat protein